MTPPQRRRRFPKPGPEQPPAPPQQEGQDPPEAPKKNPERLYVITGPDGAERSELDLVTLIVAHADPPPSATPEQAALLRLCTAPLSVAELSAYLSLPFSVVTVLLTELLAAELVTARAPVIRQALADRSLLEAVMHGLQRL
ncbi:DUF742 domain-containing protein [Streptomyces griseorubiginosus]|uniref:DUF742 domain-containing protein n=1 Tax=Streptomyces griseorubiginosus TaxID=67304 RepID=UPI002E806BBF|nr:DUF742 domain-containing protein [Streptomyces griseorubiginosus]WUB48310.1 DUF742 domain-containing protein [Streptomyces griseorubiginosus]WUB56835.1 DUF742 domain-containing protein [Streptomyces griseorubiginosus]